MDLWRTVQASAVYEVLLGTAAVLMYPTRRVRTSMIYGVLLGSAALVVALVLAQGFAGFLLSENGELLVQDFASHFAFTRSVWRGDALGSETGSAYTVATHLRIMSSWMGESVTKALPFGYSPTMLLVLLPLSSFPIPVAYGLWTAAGAAAAAWMVSNPRFHWALGLSVLLTPIALGALAIGQTAVLGTAGIFYLAKTTLADTHDGGGFAKHDLLLILVLWALSAKPPLAFTAGAAMLALGKNRPVFLAAVLAMLGAAVLTPWLGSGWVADYASLIGHYDRVDADPAFGWSLWPEHMSNLRAFLSVDLGVADDAASMVSNELWLLALALLLVTGRLRWIRPSIVWGLAILSYLLFCSHVSSTDELLLLVVPAVVSPWGSRPRGVMGYVPWFAVPAGLLLSPALGPAAGFRPSLLGIVEIGLAVWVIVQGLPFQLQLHRGPAGSPQLPTP